MPHYTARQLKHFMSFWPPFLGAGVKVKEFADDGTHVLVTHKPNILTKNAMGVAFGGTMSAMTDPFFMLASMHRLGKEYHIWDTAGEIKYIKPGRGKITADMRIPEETYALIKEKTANGDKYLHWFDVDIVDEEGDVVAHVRRQVYYRRKQQ
ncbi:DUF4442 domain-containing protein [Corynebacterium tuscaniense]|uniref:DUF4442 domain-containing protein n=1 Tax=Corynebacterium tuscaniense TaxID=302449 RepID=UPI0005107897|nr:DUF4442 domain-containing protein [Corynebacterium tuscaniense]KGF23966.1 hypothetical protein HMPREF2129_03400 [Corynebacterium tuscaniense DNF00037]